MRNRILLTILVASAACLAAQQGPSPGGGGGRTFGSHDGGPISTADISIQRIFTTVGGRLEPRFRTVHKTIQGGLVEDIYVSRGDRVTVGQPLFSVVQNDPGNRYLPVVVESRLDGIVSELLIDELEDVSPGVPAIIVIDTDDLILDAVASDLDAFSIRTGIPVSGVNSAGETYGGFLSFVSSEPDYLTGLFTLSFIFPSRGGARIGMPLFIDIPVEEVEGLFVEPDAVVRRYGRNKIWVVSGERVLNSRDVLTGPVVGSRLQILEGLEPGDSYLNSPTGNEKEGMPLKEPGANG